MRLSKGQFFGFLVAVVSRFFIGMSSCCLGSTAFAFRLSRVPWNFRRTVTRRNRAAGVGATRSLPYSITTFLAANPSPRDTAETAAEPSAKTYRLAGRGCSGGTRVEVTTNTGHFLATDVPKSMGGGDTAPQPVETLLGAWMGCTQATASFVGRRLLLERPRPQTPQGQPRPRRLRPPEVLLDFQAIEAFRDERGALELPIQATPDVPSRLHKITGTIVVTLVSVDGNDENDSSEILFLAPDELEVLKEQTEARCPIANMMVASGCAMEVEWIQETTP